MLSSGSNATAESSAENDSYFWYIHHDDFLAALKKVRDSESRRGPVMPEVVSQE